MVNNNTDQRNAWFTDSVWIGLLFSFAYFALLGTRPLFVPDEGRYAEIAREMIINHDFVTPYLNGIKYFEKPPMFYWLGAIAIKLGGLNLWALRSINALLAIIGIVSTYLFTRRVYDRATGLFASMVLGSSTLYFIMAHMISLDLTVTLFLTLTLYALFLSIEAPQRKQQRYWLWLAAALSALAVLTKGLIGIVFPGLIFLAYLCFSHDWRLLIRLPIVSGLCLFLVITAPWHLMVGTRHPDFYAFYFIEQHFLRYTQPDIGHYQPVWFFIPCLVLGFFPWVVFLPQALIATIKAALQKQRIALFLVLWASIIFVFFSLSKSKLIPYILPTLPPLAIITAHYLATIRAHSKSWSLLCSYLGLLLLTCLIAYTFITFPPSTLLPNNHLAAQWLALAAIILASGLGMSCFMRRAYPKRAISLIGITSLSFLVTVIASIPSIDARSILPLAKKIKPYLTPNTDVITYNQYYQDLPFYLERRVSILNWQNELQHGMLYQAQHDWMINDKEFWNLWYSQRRVFVIMDHDEYQILLTHHLKSQPFVIGKTINNILITNHALPHKKIESK